MRDVILRAALAGALVFAPGVAMAHEVRQAPSVPGTVAWDLLEEAEAVEWQDAKTGSSHLRPEFPADVAALDGTRVKIVGFPMSLEDGRTSQKLLLFAAQPDCFFHMSPGPQRFVEVRATRAITATDQPMLLQGRLELVRADRGGVFYRLLDAEQVALTAR